MKTTTTNEGLPALQVRGAECTAIDRAWLARNFDRSLLFDGYAVWEELTTEARQELTPKSLAWVLDALARLARKEAEAED